MRIHIHASHGSELSKRAPTENADWEPSVSLYFGKESTCWLDLSMISTTKPIHDPWLGEH